MHENINNTNYQVIRQKKLEYLRKYYKKKDILKQKRDNQPQERKD